jgi:Bacterial capsule synthesis protein PGA_cap
VKRISVLGVVLLAVVVVGGVLGFVAQVSDPADDRVNGTVVDPQGRPLAGVVVQGPAGETTTDSRGRFELGSAAGWVTAHAEGWLPRTRAAVPGEPVLVRLAAATPGTVTLTFAGDVMFGRRFYDPQDDGSGGGLLSSHAGVAEHARLLAEVRPLLAEADLTAVNLEGPLVAKPWFDPIAPRPARFHPTKDYAFASSRAAAQALARTGVDVVGLGNNHMYDALEAGVRSTRKALTGAGFPAGRGFFGAGSSVAQAWRPAVQDVGGVRVAFVGCTSILGDDQPLTYVAGPGKGGAAPCSQGRVVRAVHKARRDADVVVVMIHGGFEYGRRPSPQVRALSIAARRAGATLVVNHHPHVVGGLSAGRGLTAWTMGNLLFDQTVWPTFESYALTVAVTEGEVSAAWVEPLRVQDFVPTAVVGEEADWVARGALARSRGRWVVDDGSLWLDVGGAARRESTRVVDAGLSRVDSGCAAAAGRELLWTGDFEAQDLHDAAQDSPQAPLWNVEPGDPYRHLDSGAAHHGEEGVLLHRGSANETDVLLTVDHRVLVGERDRLTVLLDHKALHGDPSGTLQLSWYNDTKGSSQARTEVAVPVGDDWRTLRLDVRVPVNAVAVQPFVRLAPPDRGVSQLAVDDVRLIDWDSRGCDYVRGPVELRSRSLAPAAAPPAASPVAAQRVQGRAPRRLPPGPATLPE